MENTSKLITIVIPVYNREKVVVRTLDSISRQTCHEFTLILVDNGSSDGSLKVLQQWAENQPFEVKILQEHKRGAAAARQRGLNEVETLWTMFFDSDDCMTPEHMARVCNEITASHADLIGWDIRYHQSNTKCDIKHFAKKDALYRSLFDGTTGTQRYCARTELFRASGGWNTEVSVWDDIELGTRLLALNPAIVKLQGPPTVDVFLSRDSITMGERAENIEILNRALTQIEHTLGVQKAHWTDFKRILVAAKSQGNDGKELYKKVISEAKRHRFLLKLAYHYTRMGGRGITRVLRPFI